MKKILSVTQILIVALILSLFAGAYTVKADSLPDPSGLYIRPVLDGNKVTLNLGGGHFSTAGIDGIEVYRFKDGDSGTLIQKIKSSEIAFPLHDTLTVSGTYSYRFRYYKGSEYSGYSMDVGGTSQGYVNYSGSFKMSGISGEGEKIRVSWDDAAADKYIVNYTLKFESGNPKNESFTVNSPATYKDLIISKGSAVRNSRYPEITISVRAVYGSEETPKSTVTFNYLYAPMLTGSVKTSSSAAVICWEKVPSADGYEVYKAGAGSGSYSLVGTINDPSTVTFTDSNVSPDTGYRYKVRAFIKHDIFALYSAFSNQRTVYTLQSPGYWDNANSIASKGSEDTVKTGSFKSQTSGLFSTYIQSHYFPASDISDFITPNGTYAFCYKAGNNLYINKVDSSLKVSQTITIPASYPYVGGVFCDKSGDYIVVWGQDSPSEGSGAEIIAVERFGQDGRSKSVEISQGADWDFELKSPFYHGNCAVAFPGSSIVGSTAVLCTDGHQNSLAIENDSKKTYYNYVSHSFDQQVLALEDGGVLFADLGDSVGDLSGYRARGLTLHIAGQDGFINSRSSSGQRSTPFHAYGNSGQNATNLQLGGVAEVSTGIFLVGASGKSVNDLSGPRQLFVQIINPFTGKSVLSGESRKVLSGGAEETDTGIRWLTDYTDGSSVVNVVMAEMENDRIVIMWQKKNQSGAHESFYMIMSGTGEVLQQATSIGNIWINGNEELKYGNGNIYWSVQPDSSSTTINTYSLSVADGKIDIKPDPEPEPSPAPADPSDGFPDVTSTSVNATSYKAIYWAVDNGIVKGYSDGLFKPEVVCTREQFSIMLWRFADEPNASASAINRFSDADDFASGARKAVAWAVEQGIVQGFSDGSFKPKDDITRAQVAVMLWRFAGKPDVSGSSKFSDIGSFSKNVQNAIIWLEANKIASGYNDGTFQPNGGCQRQHMAIFLYRYSNNIR